MKNKYLLGLLILLAVPGVNATGTAGSSGSVDYYHTPQGSITGIIQAGDVEIFLAYPTKITRPTDTFNLGLTASVPPMIGTIAASFAAITFPAFVGCTPGTFTPTPALGTMVGAYTPITMTAASCTGVISGNIMAGATPIQSFALAFSVATDQPLLSGTLDNQNRLCAASTFEEPCMAPNINAQVNGTIITNANTTVNIATEQNLISSPWIPLYLGLIILFVATMREKPNYLAVICAGAFLAYAAYKSPFAAQELKVAVALFGGYNIILGITQLLEKNPNSDMEE